jgi:Aspartyl/Asparaginyl beta-hydroxylase
MSHGRMVEEEPSIRSGALCGPSLPPPRFPDRLRLPLTFEAGLLSRDLDAVSSHKWINHVVRQNYEGVWSIIPLRAPAGETHPVRLTSADSTHSFVDTPLLDNAPYFHHVLDCLKCPLLAARLMRLTPGSCIKEHTDLDLNFENGLARLHIPVATNDAVEFYLNKRRVVLHAGSVWYLRLSDPHSVKNLGSTDRVHLVIDVRVNAWVDALFENALRQADAAP